MAAAAGTGLGVALGACSSGSVRGASPQPAAAPLVLQFAPWGQWTSAGGKWQEFTRPPLDQFEQDHPGIRIHVVPPASGGQALRAMLAGQGPDVFSEYDIVPYLQGEGLLLNLHPYLQADNVSPGTWSSLQMGAFTTEAGVWFLPTYMNCAVMAVNLGDLDDRGLAYPDASWTYDDAQRLFRATTWDSGGQHHYGFSPVFNGSALHPSAGPLPNAQYVAEIFGGSVMDATGTRCTLDDPRVAQAIGWWEQLFWDQVAAPSNPDFPRVTFIENRNNNLLHDAVAWTKAYKWTFLPIPRYPAGQLSWCGTEGHAINAQTKDPEAAWTFLKFLNVGLTWQRYCMKTILLPPSILSLWPEFEQTLEAVVPGFVGKGLNWYAESAAHWATPGRVFRYQPVGAASLIDAAVTAIHLRKSDVAGALQSVTRQVDALEAAGPEWSAQAAAIAKRFPTSGPEIAAVPSGV